MSGDARPYGKRSHPAKDAHHALDDALRNRAVARNVREVVHVPRCGRRQIHALTWEQDAAVMHTVLAHAPPLPGPDRPAS